MLDDDVRGSIAPGLAADFAVLDRDPFTEGAEALLEARRSCARSWRGHRLNV